MIEACIGHFLVTLPCGLGAVYSTRFEIIHVTYPQRRPIMQEFREKPYLAIVYGVRIKITSNGSKVNVSTYCSASTQWTSGSIQHIRRHNCSWKVRSRTQIYSGLTMIGRPRTDRQPFKMCVRFQSREVHGTHYFKGRFIPCIR